MQLVSDSVTLHNCSRLHRHSNWHSKFKIDQMTATRLNYGKDESKKEVHLQGQV